MKDSFAMFPAEVVICSSRVFNPTGKSEYMIVLESWPVCKYNDIMVTDAPTEQALIDAKATNSHCMALHSESTVQRTLPHRYCSYS